jgi:hypothetical protein
MELFYLISILVAPGLLMAVPAVSQGRGFLGYLHAAVVATMGITFPLFTFVMSSLLLPDWKGDSAFGWLGCFHAGKIALLPLVLWACVAFYALAVLKTPNRTQPWIVLGIVTGATIASLCTMIGALIHLGGGLGLGFFLFVPLYLSHWLIWLSINLVREARISPCTYLINLAASSPFWLVTVYWTRDAYEKLPDQAPQNCFVVTAASRGTPWLVGPMEEVERSGGIRQVNQQLVRFWRLEECWSARSPGSHHCFRAIYNRIGPRLAARIRHPQAADLAYLMLKPLEWLAAMATWSARRNR